MKILTLSASGIGLATAKGYLQAGCHRVVIADINEDGIKKAASDLQTEWSDAEILGAVVNVADATSVEALVKTTVDRFGRLDYGMIIILIQNNLTFQVDG